MHESPAQIELLQVREVSPLLQGLSEEELRDLATAGHVRLTPAGSFLFKQGNPAELLYLVTRGKVLFYRVTPGGRRALLDVARPGDAIGSQGLIGETYFFTAEALVDSASVGWDGKTLARLIQAHPRLAVSAVRQAVTRMFELSEICSELIGDPAEQRLASALLRLAAKLGEPIQGSVRIAGLSEEDIGGMVGLSLFTTNRILRKWRGQGILRTGRREILILQLVELKRVVGDDAGSAQS